MDQQGGTNAFSNLPYFAHLNLIERNLIAADWADHYSTAASYLRMNGILPPTAQPKK